MKFCVIKDDDELYFGKEFEEGYRYSSYTGRDACVDNCWRSLKFFIGPDSEESCGLVIFESEDAAKSYIENYKLKNFTSIILLSDLQE